MRGTENLEALSKRGDSPTILIADDDTLIRDLLRQLLEGAGYEIIEAGNGSEVRKQLREKAADLLIIDLVMPEEEGLETIRILKSQQSGLKIIAMSGAFGGQFLKPATYFGADAVLEKPFQTDRLLATVRNLVR